ncbi:MAG: GNAT family N-acetyltransferase [Archaeoglobaceae archaeon]
MQGNIRKVTASDLQRVKEIENESFPKTPYDILTFIAYWISYPDSFLVYDDGGEEPEVRGYIIFDPHDGHIISIAVDKRCRRRGIGSRLVGEVSKRAGKAYVEARESNKEAIEFYRSLGFEKVDRVPNYYVVEDALVMVKNSN